MPGSALDTFRAQQEAVEAIHQRLQEVASLLHRMNTSIDAVAHNGDCKQLLTREESWLREAQKTVAEVSTWRAREARHFSPPIGGWIVASLFALASAAAAGAGYAWITKPYAAEILDLKARMEFAEYVEHRVVTMTPAQRRQFDALMRWPPAVQRNENLNGK
jgi:hypothetical protein